MVEFAINSSINATTGYAPFELNYGYMLQSGQNISTDTSFKGVKQFAQQAVWNLLDAHDTILEHRIGQMHYSNKCHKPSVEYQINDLVYLSIKSLALPKHREQKLMPKFIGPYIKNNDILFLKRDTKVYYNFENNEDQEWLVEEILAHKWTNNDLEFQVKWMVGDITWELLSSCKELVLE